jgi:hypothetical protein
MNAERMRKKLIEIAEYYYELGLVGEKEKNEAIEKVKNADSETLKAVVIILSEFLREKKEEFLLKLKVIEELEIMLKEVSDFAF